MSLWIERRAFFCPELNREVCGYERMEDGTYRTWDELVDPPEAVGVDEAEAKAQYEWGVSRRLRYYSL